MSDLDYNSLYRTTITNISKFIDDEEDKDVTFLFKDSDVKIKAHKFLLKAASPIFKEMLSKTFTEKPIVSITDVKPEVFQLLIKGIYLNEVPIPANDLRVAADLYYAANKYDIKDVKQISMKFMMDHCDNGSCHFLLSEAKLLNLPELENVCKKVFSLQTYLTISSWIAYGQQLQDDIVSELFTLNQLCITDEFDVYFALETLVSLGQLQEYSKSLSQIRFLTMKTRAILNCDLLTDTDKLAIIGKMEALKDSKPSAIEMPATFSDSNISRSIIDNSSKYLKLALWLTILLKGSNLEKNLSRLSQFMEIPNEKIEFIRTSIQQAKAEILVHSQSVQKVLDILKNIFPEMKSRLTIVLRQT